ncbi:MAG: threonine/serine dehydratase [Chloroflexi bacterium]|nr:threonine/serine dehydratase [Chloroflexota bacterium]
MAAETVTLEDIARARRVVERWLPRAPLERSPLLSRELGGEVWLKIETFKPTRTFKARGALNAIASLDADARGCGVVAASGGSHGLGVAWAASTLGTSAVIVMPEAVSGEIVAGCRDLGARVVLRGTIYDETLALAREIEREEDRTFISAYADPRIIAGQGTVGAEILEDLPDVELVVLPVGGGGLFAGAALALHGARSSVRVIGVEPVGSDAVGRSLAAGMPVALERPWSIADKLVSGTTAQLNLALIREHAAGCVTVDEDAILAATREYVVRHALLVEPAGAVPLAAVRSGRVNVRGTRCVLVVTGGNLTPAVLQRALSVAG